MLTQITEDEWRQMGRKSEELQAMARSRQLRGDTDGYRRAWAEMGRLHKKMRSEELIVVRPDGSTF